MTSMPFSHTSQPRPQAPSVGDSQLSSTKRMSCTAVSMPNSFSESRYSCWMWSGDGLQHHLELVVVLQAVGVLAIAAVSRAAAGLHVGGVPGLRPHRSQEGGGMESTGPTSISSGCRITQPWRA